MRVVAVTCAVWIAVMPPPLAGAVTPDPEVPVRVYQGAAAAPADLAASLAVAGAALAGAAVDVAWRSCHGTALACRTVLEPGEITVRVLRLAPDAAASRGQSLGEAFIDTATGRGVLATVFLDRVERLARLSGTDAVALLGRAIAHEIGHLLLGSTGHSPDGLMRATWSPRELRRARPHDWTFSRADMVALQAARRGYVLVD